MNKQLEKIIKDNTSGSLQILFNLISYCKQQKDIKELKFVISSSKKYLFHFSVISDFIKELEKQINIKSIEKVLDFLNKYELKQKNIGEAIYNSNRNIFVKINSFTTISYSKTLEEVIKYWSKDKNRIKAFILESRPMFEGREFALALKKYKIDSTLFVDSMMAYAVKNTDAVLIGADQILKNGNVINKVGSFPLCLCAAEFNKPVYVVAGKEKFTNKTKFSPDNYSSQEVWKTKKEINIINQYFEEVPKRFISKMLTR